MTSNLLADCLRFLSIDAVERAQSGHPGMPLGMADIATVLWTKHLKHNPCNPNWFNRDRFVLSNGHGSMLLYALLHLTGYALTIQDLQDFRQLYSKTPGHPECDTVGVETNTGPLGQGLANAVGIAIAEQTLAATFNKPNLNLVDNYTYTFVGDGCLMEGISHEACSLAGSLGLHKLIVFYDDNGISIDGPVKTWFSDDTVARFVAYNWQVIGPIDGHNADEVDKAILAAKNGSARPTLIICKTVIGYGSLSAGSAQTHGAPLGAADCAHLRQKFNWPYQPFFIPEELYAQWCHVEQGASDEARWNIICNLYQQEYPADYQQFLRRIHGNLPANWQQIIENLHADCALQKLPMATRQASQYCLEKLAPELPELFGGSADLSGSNNTHLAVSRSISKDVVDGNYLHYGVREFAMAAIMNGIALHTGFIPYGGTFLVFSDYARPAIRLSAMMHVHVIYILTHDSIGLGEDGPTHQPIEQAASLRIIPGLWVWRPATLVETAVALQLALETKAASCLLLSRQSLPALPHTTNNLIAKGGYILLGDDIMPDVIIIATGSEVQLAVEAAANLSSIKVRVVSMPCPQLFLTQDPSYVESVLPRKVRMRVAIEAAATNYWHQFVGLDGIVLGLDRFGVSAPAKDAYQALGLTATHLTEAILALLSENSI